MRVAVVGAGIAGWIEFALLRASINRRIGSTGVAPSHMARLWAAGLIAAATAWAVKLALPPLDAIIRGALVLGVFGLSYLLSVRLLRLSIPGLRR